MIMDCFSGGQQRICIQDPKYRTDYRQVGEEEASKMGALVRVRGESARVAPVFSSPKRLDFGRSRVYEKISQNPSRKNKDPVEEWYVMVGGSKRGSILKKYQDHLLPREKPMEAAA